MLFATTDDAENSPSPLLYGKDEMNFAEFPITIPHALAITTLPDHHRDPFDRMLIAQARHEGFKLVSRDPHIPSYDVPHIAA